MCSNVFNPMPKEVETKWGRREGGGAIFLLRNDEG